MWRPMSELSLPKRTTAEFIGTAFLVAAVVGSGIMGERLAGGNIALVLLANPLREACYPLSLRQHYARLNRGSVSRCMSTHRP